MFQEGVDNLIGLLRVMGRNRGKSNRGFLVKVYVEDASGARDRLVAVDDDGDAKTSGRGARPSVTDCPASVHVKGRHNLERQVASITLYGNAGERFDFPCYEDAGEQGLSWLYTIGASVDTYTFFSRSLASRVGGTA